MSVYRTIETEFDGFNYPILIGRGIISELANFVQDSTKNKKVMIVSDVFFETSIAARIKEGFLTKGFEVYEYYMDAGKGNKNFNEVLKIYGILEENNLARDSVLIAVGGGVVGDLAGFVASTWLRGMKFVQIPTTLMAMVDSSVGGKVAINYRNTINAIGNYYHPIVNMMDLELVDTLSERDYKSGLAEVIKCAIINDKKFYQYLEENREAIFERKDEQMTQFISRAIEIKIDHVSGDTREGGKRLLLNYGHTLGHAIEISTQMNSREVYRHGEGVSIGIMAAAYVAQHHLKLTNDLYISFDNIFKSYGLPTFVDSKNLEPKKEELIHKYIKNVQKDKKRIDNNLRLILANEIGQASVYGDVDFNLIGDAFKHIIR